MHLYSLMGLQDIHMSLRNIWHILFFPENPVVNLGNSDTLNALHLSCCWVCVTCLMLWVGRQHLFCCIYASVHPGTNEFAGRKGCMPRAFKHTSVCAWVWCHGPQKINTQEALVSKIGGGLWRDVSGDSSEYWKKQVFLFTNLKQSHSFGGFLVPLPTSASVVTHVRKWLSNSPLKK